MGKKQNHKPVKSEIIELARLEIDRERLKIEEHKSLLEQKLIYKHLGPILLALVSFFALFVSIVQIYTNKGLGDRQAQILREQEQRQSQFNQDQIALTRSLKNIEQEKQATDISLKLAQFLVDNQGDLLSADTNKRKRMETILFATFEPRIIVPVLERLKGIQVSSSSQNNLNELLTKAKKLESQNKNIPPQNVNPPLSSVRYVSPISALDKTLPRVALVIGNSTYKQASTLRNTVNDARDITAALKELDFDVIYLENANQIEMHRSIQTFGEKLRSSKGVGLFYYSGHAIQIGGNNRLIPTDGDVRTAEDIDLGSIDIGLVLDQMKSASNKLNIIILDTCRNSPFATTYNGAMPGLAEINAPMGTIVAYATAPGGVASDGTERNGIYTQELLKNLRTPDITIEEVFKRTGTSVAKLTGGMQIPWFSSSVMGNFYFVNKKEVSTSQLSDLSIK